MMTLALLRDFARYDRWATERVLAAADRLPEADYRRDVGLFFKSVHGTLNHLLVAQHQLWLHICPVLDMVAMLQSGVVARRSV